MAVKKLPPILSHKQHHTSSLFTPENLIREAKRQKNLESGQIPEICVLDPDGDIVRNLQAMRRSQLNPHWACYHSQMYTYHESGIEIGIVGCAVGGSFAVVVAEQMFVSGCKFLISITSSGQITQTQQPPYFICIERALRDEGTSYHYLPPSNYSNLGEDVAAIFKPGFADFSVPVYWGSTWTTDAPFRETAEAIDYANSLGILAVEMEAAALYAFAKARQKYVLCFAHVTNQMGNIEGDFEKGEADGSRDALNLINLVAGTWQQDKPG